MLIVGIICGTALALGAGAVPLVWLVFRRVKRQPEFAPYEPTMAARRVRAQRAWERGTDAEVTRVLPLDEINDGES